VGDLGKQQVGMRGNSGLSVRVANAMIKIDAAKIASHKTDKSPQFLAKVRSFESRGRSAALGGGMVVQDIGRVFRRRIEPTKPR
jgi:hypothetical protein